jgi:[ribosomal protein S18]-alanine N-acetyltransferase
VTVRAAEQADVATVTALEEAVFGVDAWTEQQVEEELLSAHRSAWVFGTPAVGYVVTTRPGAPGDTVDLHRIAVRADHRRRGVGTALLETALASVREEGAQRVLLEVGAENHGAIAFYEAEECTEIDRRPRYYRDGADAVVMRRRLDG